jgi:uracil-DNA glycosylase family 4
MSLNLDPRQRAMLAEMGVPVWWPYDADPALAEAEAAAATTPVVAAAAPRPADEIIRSGSLPGRAAQSVPGTLLPLPTAIDQMDWAQLQQAVAGCQACRMCLGRKAPVLLPPPAHLTCDWLVLGEPPDDAQERAGRPFVDDSGRLLDNMLRAVGVKRADTSVAAGDGPATHWPSAYLSAVLKCRPSLPTAPDEADLAVCAHYLRREIALLQPRVILAMGRFAMQVVLQEAHPQGLKLPLGKLRGTVWRYQNVPVVVTYPPAYLLRTAADKARAWQDLCLAADVVDGLALQP